MTDHALEATVTNNPARRRYEAVVEPAGVAGFVEYHAGVLSNAPRPRMREQEQRA